jgi:hypothetical protein
MSIVYCNINFFMPVATHGHEPSIYVCVCVCVGDDNEGPLNNQGKPAYLRKKQTQENLKNTRKINPWAHGPPDSRPSHPRAELCFARGARCRTGRTPPRSRAERPLV